jgi:hypothetical protein
MLKRDSRRNAGHWAMPDLPENRKKRASLLHTKTNNNPGNNSCASNEGNSGNENGTGSHSADTA